MLGKLIKSIFGDKNERALKHYWRIVEVINQHFESYHSLSDEELCKKTEEFKERLATNNEDLDDLLPEAFAVVKETCRRLLGKRWLVTGREIEWDMVPFDVQLIGGIVLHEGKIAEMATGEGKTLVATLPLYLNALTGKGVHLVTVNDYLAQRDSEWMGEIFKFLGLTVGCILSQMPSDIRKKQYECDITYGTNNEFGFDYLRDNMATRPEEVVQRGHYYAIVDEVDSVLIDEARTPLIIAGPSHGDTSIYTSLKPAVESLVKKQRELINNVMARAEELSKKLESGTALTELEEYELGKCLLKAHRGMPKHKRLLKLLAETGMKRLMTAVEHSLITEKKLHTLDEELYFSIDEKQHSVDISEKGRQHLAKVQNTDDTQMYVLPDFSEEIHRIRNDPNLTEEQKEIEIEKFESSYSAKSERIHNLSQLLRAFTLYERDVEYVVQDGKIYIVDEHTGRLMVGRRYSDGLHQAIEAKEGVTVEGETQTIATITLQNYFRLYQKLAGMTGTAATEEDEFYSIYKLEVITIPTHRPMIRVDHDDLIYKTKAEKYEAIINHIEELHKKGLPILIGTISVEVSELLSKLLSRRGIQHNVLNAKHHQREAEIIALAGKKGAVTIATNMAGRGTDIKLSPDVIFRDENGNLTGGLQIIGTERHESRRIDRQLRGRSGRQGDPGASVFFLSLEDNLMRLFGSERISSIMDRIGVKKGEVITHPWITKSIENAQKRVEQHNFSIRKQLLEYDDVMNQQREAIYTKRRKLLFGENPYEFFYKSVSDFVEDLISEYTDRSVSPFEWDWEGIAKKSIRIFGFNLALSKEEQEHTLQDDLREIWTKKIIERFERKKNAIGEELFTEFLRFIQLRVIDEKWRDHLAMMDRLKEGVGLRAYGQKDPLIEYKKEGFELFQQMLYEIDETVLKIVFHADIQIQESPRTLRRPERIELRHTDSTNMGFASVAQGSSSFSAPTLTRGSQALQPQPEEELVETQERIRPQPVVRSTPKVGRNEPCPCGSGKKYKNCHGQ